MKVAMTEVIAVRRLLWKGVPDHEVLVRIGKPAETPGVASEFYCPIQTTGLGSNELDTAVFGIDALQAIELAIRFVRYRLVDINASNDGCLRWLDEPLPADWAQEEE